MKKETTSQEPKSSIVYEELENFVRFEAQKMIQRILEEEVTELWGRQKYERKHPLDARSGSRNGYGKPRKLTMSCGTITIRRPRVRNLEERFESRILPLFERRTKEADEQRFWKHRMCNVLDKLPRKFQPEATGLLQKIMYAETEQEASQRKAAFQRWCREHGQERAGGVLDRGWEQMITFYKYPKAHWKHLRTSNPAESPFASVRLRTNAAKRFKKVENATAVIWKMLMITEKKFRRLSAPELMKDDFEGRQYENGIKKCIDTKRNIA